MLCSICHSDTHFRVDCPKGGESYLQSNTSFLQTVGVVPIRPNQPPGLNPSTMRTPPNMLAGTQPQIPSAAAAGAGWMPRPPNYFVMDQNTPDLVVNSDGTHSVIHHAFPVFDHQVYHANVRLAHTESLLIDTGSVKNIAGDKWAQRVAALAKKHGQGSSFEKIDKVFVDGIGSGASSCDTHCQVPIRFKNGVSSTFQTNLISQSEVPALLGLDSMSNHSTLLDIPNRKIIFLGQGKYSVELPPGSMILSLERAPTGHLLLPISEWQERSSTTPAPSFVATTKPGEISDY